MRGRGVLGGREISRQQSRQESRDVPGLGSWRLKQGPGCQPGSWDSLLLLARVREHKSHWHLPVMPTLAWSSLLALPSGMDSTH